MSATKQAEGREVQAAAVQPLSKEVNNFFIIVYFLFPESIVCDYSIRVIAIIFLYWVFIYNQLDQYAKNTKKPFFFFAYL